jgi:drug/metabolite transporter (DMT)-like permease
MRQDRDLWLGSLLIAGSALAYSLSGYFTRLIEQDVWTVLFWRGLFGGLFIGAYVALQHRSNLPRAVQAMGWPGFWVTLFSTLATVCFISALKLAPVAEVMTIHAAIPFLTAVLAATFVGVRESWVTWGASIVALGGVAIMVDPSASGIHMTGYGFAGVMALSYAAMMVIIRQQRHVSMLPAAALSAGLCALVVLPAARPLAVPASDLLPLALFGTIQFGLGLLLMTIGTRMISATNSALIGSLENPLAPVWVWLAFNEAPTFAACIGGSLVMAAVIGDVSPKAMQTRRAPRSCNAVALKS